MEKRKIEEEGMNLMMNSEATYVRKQTRMLLKKLLMELILSKLKSIH